MYSRGDNDCSKNSMSPINTWYRLFLNSNVIKMSIQLSKNIFRFIAVLPDTDLLLFWLVFHCENKYFNINFYSVCKSYSNYVFVNNIILDFDTSTRNPYCSIWYNSRNLNCRWLRLMIFSRRRLARRYQA